MISVWNFGATTDKEMVTNEGVKLEIWERILIKVSVWKENNIFSSIYKEESFKCGK